MDTKTKVWKWVTSVIALITLLALGGLFVSKLTIGFPLLKYIPAIVHPWVGWILIAIGSIQFIILLVLAIVKALK